MACRQTRTTRSRSDTAGASRALPRRTPGWNMRTRDGQFAQPPRGGQPRGEITAALIALRGAPPDAGPDGAASSAAGAREAARQAALERLVPLVYGELRRVAHRQLGAERAGHTLNTTALVHEAYLRLADQTRVEWADRAHFFAVAARAMRRILVDYARRHRALRRGGGQRPISLDAVSDAVSDADAADGGAPGGVQVAVAERADALVALDEALERLAAVDGRLARVVECRFFGGLTEAETAEVLGVTPRTVTRDWVKARAWLYQELRPDAV